MNDRCQLRTLLWALTILAALTNGTAFAGGQTTQFSVNGGTLVRGAAPLPEFKLDFLLDDAGRQAPSLPGNDNLEISLTSPDNSVFRFAFSPRPQFGFSLDKATGLTTRSYAGLTWNLFDSSSVFGNLGFAGTYDPALPNARLLGPPILFHSAIEFGYHLNEQNSVSLSLDQGRPPELRTGVETNDNLRLRYGLKF